MKERPGWSTLSIDHDGASTRASPTPRGLAAGHSSESSGDPRSELVSCGEADTTTPPRLRAIHEQSARSLVILPDGPISNLETPTRQRRPLDFAEGRRRRPPPARPIRPIASRRPQWPDGRAYLAGAGQRVLSRATDPWALLRHREFDPGFRASHVVLARMCARGKSDRN